MKTSARRANPSAKLSGTTTWVRIRARGGLPWMGSVMTVVSLVQAVVTTVVGTACSGSPAAVVPEAAATACDATDG